MSKKEKLIRRLKSKPKDLTFAELETLLLSLGFKLSNKGRTSGSKTIFIKGKIIIEVHKPHAVKTLHVYQILDVLRALETEGLI